MAQWDDQSARPTGAARASGNGSLPSEEEAQAQIQQAIENARDEIDRYISTAADFIRERPVVCVAGAVAVGFLIGRIASRR